MSLIRRLNPHPEAAQAEPGQSSSGTHQGSTFHQLYMGSVTRFGEDGKYGQISTRRLAIGRDEYAAGGIGSTAPHSHETMEQAYYIISGEALMRVGDEEATVGPGTAVYMPPHVVHSFQNMGNEPLTLLVIEVDLGAV